MEILTTLNALHAELHDRIREGNTKHNKLIEKILSEINKLCGLLTLYAEKKEN